MTHRIRINKSARLVIAIMALTSAGFSKMELYTPNGTGGSWGGLPTGAYSYPKVTTATITTVVAGQEVQAEWWCFFECDTATGSWVLRARVTRDPREASVNDAEAGKLDNADSTQRGVNFAIDAQNKFKNPTVLPSTDCEKEVPPPV